MHLITKCNLLPWDAGITPVDYPESRDAAHECRHGRLDGDGTAPCGCWNEDNVSDFPPAEPENRSTWSTPYEVAA